MPRPGQRLWSGSEHLSSEKLFLDGNSRDPHKTDKVAGQALSSREKDVPLPSTECKIRAFWAKSAQA